MKNALPHFATFANPKYEELSYPQKSKNVRPHSIRRETIKRHHSEYQNYVKDCTRCLTERDGGQFSRRVMRRMNETRRRKKNKVSKVFYRSA